jgi:hypothetical protein
MRFFTDYRHAWGKDRSMSRYDDAPFRIRSVKGPPLYDPVCVIEHIHGREPVVGTWLDVDREKIKHPNLVSSNAFRIERLTPTDEHRVYEVLLRPIHYQELGIVSQTDEDVFRQLFLEPHLSAP